MATAQETGEVTGTLDKDYNIIWFTEIAARSPAHGGRKPS